MSQVISDRVVNLSRRGFIKGGVLISGGLILGVCLPKFSRADSTSKDPDEQHKLNAWVRIGNDESITVIVNHSELGQGPYTSMPMVVADEMDADWSHVRAEEAPVDPAYNHPIFGMQMTGGSTSTWTEWDRLRKAGATARMMLITAAAQTWNVDPSTCRTELGAVHHDASRRKLTFGQLVEKAAALTPPADVKTKDPKDFKIVGKPIKRLDTPDKTNGKAMFGIDVTLPGMLVALVARSPVFGGKVASFNSDKAKSMPGVKHIVQIERGIAVVADGFWHAKNAREALEIVWDEGPNATLDSAAQGAEYAKLAQSSGAVATKVGDASGALKTASKKFEAIYELPYLAHATIEPMNCVADVREDRCEIWVGTQFQTMDRNLAAKDLGFKPEQVQLHTMFCGGGFGRRAVPDSHFVREAVQISKAIKTPVKVIWTREDDMRGGYYRPRAYHTLRAGVTNSELNAWQHRIVCQSFLIGSPFEAMVKDGVDQTAVEGAADIPYTIANIDVDWQNAPTHGVPTLWLRSVGHSHNAFAVESFLDEIAHDLGVDPFEYRRKMLGDHARHKRVLETVAEKFGWDKSLAKGHGKGIAVHDSFGSFVAHAMEVSVDDQNKLHLHRVVCAIDCGPIVNPNTIKAQLEGATVFGLTAAIYGQITFENGRVKQGNFYDYPMLRMHEMPVIEPHVVISTDRMGGVGEPGVPSVAPALGNAIFNATGKRIRTLPMCGWNMKLT